MTQTRVCPHCRGIISVEAQCICDGARNERRGLPPDKRGPAPAPAKTLVEIVNRQIVLLGRAQARMERDGTDGEPLNELTKAISSLVKEARQLDSQNEEAAKNLTVAQKSALLVAHVKSLPRQARLELLQELMRAANEAA